MSTEVNQQTRDARKTAGVIMSLLKKRHISREAEAGICEGITEPSLLYGCEVWVLNIQEC